MENDKGMVELMRQEKPIPPMPWWAYPIVVPLTVLIILLVLPISMVWNWRMWFKKQDV